MTAAVGGLVGWLYHADQNLVRIVADFSHQEQMVMENKQAIQKDIPQMKTDIEVIKERQVQTNQRVQDIDKKLEGVDQKVNKILDAVERHPHPIN